MLLSAVSVLVVVQSTSEIPEGLMNNPVLFVNNQLKAQFFFSYYIYFNSTCFEQPCAHQQENQLYQYIWYMSLYVGDRLVCRFGFHPDVVLIQLILLMMSTWLLETGRELK